MKLRIDECFETYRARVYRWALALCRHHEDALDVTQEVFVRVVQHEPDMDSGAALSAWLRRTTGRIVIDRWRSGSAETAALARYQPKVADSEPQDSEVADAVRSAVAALSEQQRLVLLGKCVDGMTFSQVAAGLSIAVPTAKTHYLRALEAVRRRLAARIAVEHKR